MVTQSISAAAQSLEFQSMTTETVTVAQYIIGKGADILAVDNYGKHAIFQLLESRPSETWISFISHSLDIITTRAPQLVNQCDNAGNSPLHASLRRLSRLAKHWLYAFKPNFLELYGVVYHLLDKGADPKLWMNLETTFYTS
jgi:hypothetical protein